MIIEDDIQKSVGNEGPIFQILLEVDVTRNSSRREQGNDLVKSTAMERGALE